ncbi:hypothetical protein [Streptomyces sp. NPDC127108]|uniref:hypothetical protein n=1 Tax=Streptomyces sp. NPDC127108 TaxID=3345361 RepID=UPI0036427841
MPLKNIGSIRLYRPEDAPSGWPTLGRSLTRQIRWDLIAQQYDQMAKYAPRAKKLSRKDRQGLTVLSWPNFNLYGTFRLHMDKRLDLLPAAEPEQHRRPRRDHLVSRAPMDVIHAGTSWWRWTGVAGHGA